MPKRLLKIFIPLFLLCQQGQAQSQEMSMLTYNVGYGAITSAVGSVVNKPKKAKWAPYFLKGLWQGSLGGLLNFGAKKTLYLVNRDQELAWAWPARIIHAAGTSIIANSALNEPFLQNWNIDFGPVRFDFKTNGSTPLKVRLLPLTIHGIIYSYYFGAHFDPGTTLATGTLAFVRDADVLKNIQAAGVQNSNTFAYVSHGNKYSVIAHELVHTMQYREYLVGNTWLKQLPERYKDRFIYKLFDKYIYPEIPFLWAAYTIEGRQPYSRYYRNWFELEAQYFATNKHVNIY